MKSDEKSRSIGTPVSELEIDTTLVYNLLAEQHPDLTYLPIHFVEAGCDMYAARYRTG
ncbi:MAG: hypothetical protein PUP93_23130 [Rhizonema sp. NSF051]|nr:hypothetical protein [Rhizonema sp. NSF051]